MMSRSLTCCLIALLGLPLSAAAQGPTAANRGNGWLAEEMGIGLAV